MVKITYSFQEFLTTDDQFKALTKFIDNYKRHANIKEIAYIRTGENEMTFRFIITTPETRNYLENNYVDVNVNMKKGEVNFIRLVKGTIIFNIEDSVILKQKEEVKRLVNSLIAGAGNQLLKSLHLR